MKKLDPSEEMLLNKIVKRYTGWDSFAQMCRAHPTLRTVKSMRRDEAEAIRIMRSAYKDVTGREAFPATGWDEAAKRKGR